jgi:hypothetical protein
MDKVAEKFEDDKKKFLEQMQDLLEKTRRDSDKDREIAKGAEAYKTEIAKARAENQVKLMQLHKRINEAPKVMAMSFGIPKMVQVEGHSQLRIYPETITIGDMHWTFKPNVPMMVPQPVADALAAKLRAKQEGAEVEEALQANMEMGKLDQKLSEIRSKTEAPYDESKVGIPPITSV